MSQQETAKEEWERLRNELGASPYHSEMTREQAEKLNDEFFIRNSYAHSKFWAMISARERMAPDMPAQVDKLHETGKHHRMHPAWTLANEKLVAGRGAAGGGNYGQL